MLPALKPGDLAVSLREDQYLVGDIVSYHEPNTHALIIHRIIDEENGRVVTKGDNVPSTDNFHPSHEEIIGKAWLTIPRLGNVIQWIRAPWIFSLFSGLLIFIIFSDFLFKSQESTIKATVKRSLFIPPINNYPSFLGIAAPALVMLAILNAALLVWSFMQPAYQKSAPYSYAQKAAILYTTNPLPGIYDMGAAEAGDPIFTKLTCNLNITYAYSINGEGLQNVGGTYQIFSIIRDDHTGWKKTIPILPPANISGSSIYANNTIDLCQIIGLVEKFEAETGTHSWAYRMDIVTQVGVTGEINGVAFQDSFDNTLNFEFDRLNFYLIANEEDDDPFNFAKETKVESPVLKPNTLTFLGLTFNVSQLRMLLILTFLASLFGLLYSMFSLNQLTRENLDARIKMTHGVLIVEASDFVLKLAPIIEFTSIDELAKLASSLNTAILRTQVDDRIFYTVRSESISYRYIHSPSK